MRWAFEHMQKPDGSAVWLRLSTRGLEQPARTPRPGRGDRRRPLGGAAGAGRVARHRLPGAGGAGGGRRRSDKSARRCRGPGCSPSPARTGCTRTGWRAAAQGPGGPRARRATSRPCWRRSRRGAALVTVLDGHPAAHAWLGAVRGQRVVPLGVDRFGQAGDLPDLYREYGLDEDAILDACAQALLGRLTAASRRRCARFPRVLAYSDKSAGRASAAPAVPGRTAVRCGPSARLGSDLDKWTGRACSAAVAAFGQ